MNGHIVAIFGNILIAETDGNVVQNGIAHCLRADGARLLCEVIRVRGKRADLQSFEETRGLKIGDQIEFHDDMLSVELGPGLLGTIYDGLQNRLSVLAEDSPFLEAGKAVPGLDHEQKWEFKPTVGVGAKVGAATKLGVVLEGLFEHHIMSPFRLEGRWTVKEIVPEGTYALKDRVAVLEDAEGNTRDVAMIQLWPVKRPLMVAKRRLLPDKPLVTGTRIIDSMFPIVQGGTYCIPGPFGAGKTVLQHITAKYARADVVIVAACGERAGEVVETIRDLPEIVDPRTNRPLMERTIIICNTSAMPVAAREASVYTALTMAEYYRQMGLNVLMLADSTSRWAQAMREVSGRLEEIPGEEAFPAYLESRIAAFYERAGAVELHDGRIASVTIGGTVSPAGGNFEEPVTQGTLKVVGAFHGLSRSRSDARRFPAIDPIESWSKYTGIIPPEKVERMRDLLRDGNEVKQMMTVVGEEGTPIEDFILLQKSELFDSVFLQQNAFDAVDADCPPERQRTAFEMLMEVSELDLTYMSKEGVRKYVFELADLIRNWNYAAEETDEYRETWDKVQKKIAAAREPSKAPVETSEEPEEVKA
jgi:V/A-type H+-transporting ATPase subunit A